MWSLFGWVLFGFAIWALMLIKHVVQKRYAPEWNGSSRQQGAHKPYRRNTGRNTRRSGFWDSMWDGGDDDDESLSGSERAALEQEISDLKERVKVLEAIVTDRSWQFEQELQGRQ